MQIPPWFIAWYEAEYIFHSIIDLLFIALGFAIVAVVSRPGWRQHLRWASPAAAASVLTGMDRFGARFAPLFFISERRLMLI